MRKTIYRITLLGLPTDCGTHTSEHRAVDRSPARGHLGCVQPCTEVEAMPMVSMVSMVSVYIYGSKYLPIAFGSILEVCDTRAILKNMGP